VKPDVDTLLTVPDAPPEAGPDRALDPRPAPAADGDVTVAGDVPHAAERPMTALISTATRIQRLPLFDFARNEGRAEAVSWEFLGS